MQNTVTPTENPPEWAELRPCQCSRYADADTGARLECDGVTYRTFAVGHDARLKGFLIRIGRNGHRVRVTDTGEVVSATEAAERYGFAHMVADGVRRTTRKTTAPVASSPPPAASQREGAPVVRRVGRWAYRGRVRRIGDEEVFVYSDRYGNERQARDFAA